MRNYLILLYISLSYTLPAQTIFLEENFDDCTFPSTWSLQHHPDSKGWSVVNADEISTTTHPFPDLDGNCFAGNNDNKWDDGQGSNIALDDQLILPYLDLSSAEHIVISFDYVTPYVGGVKVYYRLNDQEPWKSINNIHAHGGMLSWQKKTGYIYGHANSPINSMEEPIQFMFQYSDFGYSSFLGLGLDNIKIYEPSPNEVVLEDVMIPEVVPIGIIPIKAGLLNHGTNVLSSLKVKWQIDNGPVSEQIVNSFRISNGSAYGGATPFGSGTIPEDDILVDFQNEGEFLLKVWVEFPDGIIEDNLENNSWEKIISVRNNLPEKEFIYEKFSHNTCAPCYEADLTAIQIAQSNPKIHLVSLHQSTSDPMDYPEARVIDRAYSQRTHPGSIIDRRFMGHWEHGIMSSLKQSLPLFTTPWWSPAEVYFTNKIVDENARTVDLEIEAKFIKDLSKEYRLNIWTIEDGIIEFQASAPEGNDYIHNHVLRNYTGGNYGQEGSLPELIKAGEAYKYNATIDLDLSWNLKNLSFIAIIQKFEENSDQRQIVNASLIHINEEIIVSQSELEINDLKIYPNPSSDFIHIVLPSTNLALNYTIFDASGKQVSSQKLKNHAPNYIQLDVRNYNSGNYILVMEIDGTIATKNFIVHKQ